MFADDDGHLFAMTYEPGTEPRYFVYDIFNKDGAFIGRKSLDNYAEYSGLEAIAKKKSLYYLKEKESGYKELVVYRMNWE